MAKVEEAITAPNPLLVSKQRALEIKDRDDYLLAEVLKKS